MCSKANSKDYSVQASDLSGFKYLESLWPLLERLQEVGASRDKAGNRRLFFDQYVVASLLYFFNPVITSLRSLQQASELDAVQKVLGIKHLSLGSLSECTTVFDAQSLRQIVVELAQRVAAQEAANQPVGAVLSPAQRHQLQALTALDGTLLRALPRMAWALWLDENNRAAKMHLQFDILKSIPCDATITAGNHSEIQATAEMLQPDRFYVMDRGYASYRWFAEILEAGSSFVARVKTNAVFTVARECPLDTQALEAGVTRDVVIDKLGTAHHKNHLKQPVRLVVVETMVVETTKEDGTPHILWLVTDHLDLDASLVALAYRYRWSIELFFRWFKCILGCRHLLSQKQQGVAIQCYVALIASLLISLWTKLKPTKRTWEMVQFYILGWATLHELENHNKKRQKAAAAEHM